jgi:hypothetical protein
VADSCEYGNERLGSIKYGKFLGSTERLSSQVGLLELVMQFLNRLIIINDNNILSRSWWPRGLGVVID